MAGTHWDPLVPAPSSPAAPQVVEELLSGNPHLEKESARSIADGAMMEAASICVGQMVGEGSLLYREGCCAGWELLLGWSWGCAPMGTRPVAPRDQPAGDLAPWAHP